MFALNMQWKNGKCNLFLFIFAILSKTATEFIKIGIYSDVEYNIINNYVQGGEIN